ncbi:MAG: hypothetical protein IKZ72_03155 [Bacteroidales bacterium]|nr:hypothetical protein [Bacteroidales bacterium]
MPTGPTDEAGMDIIQVTRPDGGCQRIRVSALRGIGYVGTRTEAKRFFAVYKSGRRLEIDRDSATRLFDAMSPKLFETT